MCLNSFSYSLVASFKALENVFEDCSWVSRHTPVILTQGAEIGRFEARWGFTETAKKLKLNQTKERRKDRETIEGKEGWVVLSGTTIA